MSDEQKPQVRVRVNIAHTASGKYTWDGTVEITGPIEEDDILQLQAWREEAINQSDALVAELKARYGPKEQDLEAALKASIMAVEEAKKTSNYRLIGKGEGE